MSRTKVYFAGKVKHRGGYRRCMTNSSRIMSEGYSHIQLYDGGTYDKTTHRITNYNDAADITYFGPFAISDDHGCFHGDTKLHGCGPAECTGYMTLRGSGFDEHSDTDGDSPSRIISRCLWQIENADLVVAYIDTRDEYATFAEIGYASALGKPVLLAVSKAAQAANCTSDPHQNRMKDEFWFLHGLRGVSVIPTAICSGCGEEVPSQSAIVNYIKRMSE